MKLKTSLYVLVVGVLCLALVSCGDGGKANFEKGVKLYEQGQFNEAAKSLHMGGFDADKLIGVLEYRGLYLSGKPSFTEAHKLLLYGIGVDSVHADIPLCKGHSELVALSESPEFVDSNTFYVLEAALEYYEEAKNMGFKKTALNEDIALPLDDVIDILQHLVDLESYERKLRKIRYDSVIVGPAAESFSSQYREGWGVKKMRGSGEMYIGFWDDGELTSPYIYVAHYSDDSFFVRCR